MNSCKEFFLQNLFPQQGKSVPRIRFKGFHDKWKTVTGKDLFVSISDKHHATLPVLSATQDKGMILRNKTGIDIKYKKSNLDMYKLVKPGDFVIHLRSFQGGFAYSGITGIVSPAYTVFTFKKNIKFDDKFWQEYFTSYRFIQSLKKITYGIRDGRSIRYSDFLTLNLTFPSFSEQRAIGALLTCLDNKISLEQKRLWLLA